MPRHERLEAGHQRKVARYREAIAQGLMTHWPGTLPLGKSHVDVALDELRRLRDEDKRMATDHSVGASPSALDGGGSSGPALGGAVSPHNDQLLDETNADKLNRALGRSIDVVEEELRQDYRAVDPETGHRMTKREFKQLPERKLQMQVAMDVIKVSARIAAERLKTQRADVLAGLLAEMKKRDMVVEPAAAPPTIGFGEDE